MLEVLGTPAPKGSAQAFYNKYTKRAVLVPGGAKSTRERMLAWGDAVRAHAMRVLGNPSTPPFVDVPLDVEIVFHMKRPKLHYGTGKNAEVLKVDAPQRHMAAPDVDKLARATLDAMTDAVFDDDSRIVRLVAEKDYTTTGVTGATITVRQWAPESA